jgi:dihydroxyacetone synthase
VKAGRKVPQAKNQSAQLSIKMVTPTLQTLVPLAATEKKEKKEKKENLNDDDRAVLALRNFIFDICNQNGGGHGGSAIGMAAIGVALYKYTMRYNPSNPEWFDRDRFVLSNGM